MILFYVVRKVFFAYQLAVVCDDIDQHITHVVRGIDLLSSTAGQRQLYANFGVAPPQYAHIPILCSSKGQKLSKQNKAAPLDMDRTDYNLQRVLRLLNHPAPDALLNAPVDKLLAWAVDNWDINKLKNITTQIISDND
jgi:glutamyl-Q tRNA(Asp) synthetase